MGSARAVVVVCVALVASSASACSLEDLDARTRFLEDSVAREGAVDWPGGTVRVALDAAGIGDVRIVLDPGAKRVSATATLVAVADTFDKSSADLANEDVKRTFTVTTEGDVTTVACPHGAAHGSATATESGCEKLVVRVPAGTPDRKLTLDARAPRGTLVVDGAAGVLASASLVASDGDLDAALSVTPGVTIAATSESAGIVTLHLPASFAADRVTLEAPSGTVETSAFPDVKSGAARGAPGTGAASITARSLAKAGKSGRVLVVPQ